ncbi:hypothetical protein HNP87_001627 [Methanococcus maripaludis]|uniref:Uncharacterized protein n=1 Tax=Methanococcus maripaludis TaxID=39152 RepID=A0A7J9NJH4_METMI|nr:hypothetical protein [Methanococcus maripaludis]MBA2841078.1 hypothetical protein [Methanococcus maripaludis]MBA2853633.1 hypothetical protein [Methanococcus maripaludis]MBA2860726.1 hypothetical protein [Methanococcus maripaludis]
MSNKSVKADYKKLMISIVLDIVGMATYLIPGLGESGDFVWAPIYALIIRNLYHSSILGFFGGFEELLIGTDIIPSATILWILETFGIIKNKEFQENYK